jgi:hypothetical protein
VVFGVEFVTAVIFTVFGALVALVGTEGLETVGGTVTGLVYTIDVIGAVPLVVPFAVELLELFATGVAT